MVQFEFKDQYSYVRDAVCSLESALVSCGPGSDTVNWEHYRQIAAALINVTNLLIKLEGER